MNFAIVQNGEIRQFLQLDMPFTVGEKTYSSAFLRNSSPQEKLEAGVWEIIHGQRPDDRYYWVSNASYHVNEVNSTVEASYPATAKDLEELKANAVTQIKAAASSALSATDWMVIRKVERDVAIPDDVAAARAQIVSDCNTKEAAIVAASDVEALIAALQG